MNSLARSRVRNLAAGHIGLAQVAAKQCRQLTTREAGIQQNQEERGRL